MSAQLGADPLAAHAIQAAELAAVLREHPGAAGAFADLAAAMAPITAEDLLADHDDVLDQDLLTLTMGEIAPFSRRVTTLSA